MPRKKKPYTFIWNTYGDWVATLMDDGSIWDTRGVWLGWVEGDDREVWKRDGEWIGHVSKDGRILRKRNAKRRPLREDIPDAPDKPDNLPGRAPLPPTFSGLTFSTIDVLEEHPDIFKRLSDLKPDMD